MTVIIREAPRRFGQNSAGYSGCAHGDASNQSLPTTLLLFRAPIWVSGEPRKLKHQQVPFGFEAFFADGCPITPGLGAGGRLEKVAFQQSRQYEEIVTTHELRKNNQRRARVSHLLTAESG